MLLYKLWIILQLENQKLEKGNQVAKQLGKQFQSHVTYLNYSVVCYFCNHGLTNQPKYSHSYNLVLPYVVTLTKYLWVGWILEFVLYQNWQSCMSEMRTSDRNWTDTKRSLIGGEGSHGLIQTTCFPPLTSDVNKKNGRRSTSFSPGRRRFRRFR